MEDGGHSAWTNDVLYGSLRAAKVALRKSVEFSCTETYRELWVGEGDRAGDKEDLFEADLAALMAAADAAEARFDFDHGGRYKLRKVGGRVVAQQDDDCSPLPPMPVLIDNGSGHQPFTWEERWDKDGGHISTYWTTHVEGGDGGDFEETTHTIVSRQNKIVY